MAVWLAERREIRYQTEAENDPDRLALTEERKKEEREEKEAMEREKKADLERRQAEYMNPMADHWYG